MKNKRLQIILGLLLLVTSVRAQVTVEGSPVKWYTIEQAMELRKKEMKPLMIDVYTDWCGWCKHMMATTFASPGLAGYINNNFYPVRFDAETHDTIKFMDTLYYNRDFKNKTGKTHDLAKKLLNNSLSYPTLIYMDRQGNRAVVPGYMQVYEIEPFLVYFSENINTSATIQEFRMNFMFSFPKPFSKELAQMQPNEKLDTTGIIKWNTFEKTMEQYPKEPKLLFIYAYYDQCISCKVMERTSFRNSVVANYINKNYYPLKLNIASTDSIVAFGQTFKGANQTSPHQLAVALFQNNFKFPATIVMSQNQLLFKNQEYLSPSVTESVLKYFGENIYKTKDLQSFLKDFKGEVKKQ